MPPDIAEEPRIHGTPNTTSQVKLNTSVVSVTFNSQSPEVPVNRPSPKIAGAVIPTIALAILERGLAELDKASERNLKETPKPGGCFPRRDPWTPTKNNLQLPPLDSGDPRSWEQNLTLRTLTSSPLNTQLGISITARNGGNPVSSVGQAPNPDSYNSLLTGLVRRCGELFERHRGPRKNFDDLRTARDSFVKDATQQLTDLNTNTLSATNAKILSRLLVKMARVGLLTEALSDKAESMYNSYKGKEHLTTRTNIALTLAFTGLFSKSQIWEGLVADARTAFESKNYHAFDIAIQALAFHDTISTNKPMLGELAELLRERLASINTENCGIPGVLFQASVLLGISEHFPAQLLKDSAIQNLNGVNTSLDRDKLVGAIKESLPIDNSSTAVPINRLPSEVLIVRVPHVYFVREKGDPKSRVLVFYDADSTDSSMVTQLKKIVSDTVLRELRYEVIHVSESEIKNRGLKEVVQRIVNPAKETK